MKSVTGNWGDRLVITDFWGKVSRAYEYLPPRLRSLREHPACDATGAQYTRR